MPKPAAGISSQWLSFSWTDCDNVYMVGRLTVQQAIKKGVRVCICYSFHESRLWHVPIWVEQATRNLTLYDMTIREHNITYSKVVIIPEGAYRWLVLDSDIETAKFRSVKNKRRINAIICLHPPCYPGLGLRGQYANTKLIINSEFLVHWA